MKRIYTYLILVLMFAGMGIITASCSDDDEAPNEWTGVSYVSLMPEDYLRPVPTFTLDHLEGEGVNGTFEYSFVISIPRPISEDILVKVGAECDAVSSDKIQITSPLVTLKANATTSEPFSVKIADWSELNEIKDKKELSLKVKALSIQPTVNPVVLTDFRKEVSMKIIKNAMRKKTEVLLQDPTKWIFTFMEGVENAASNSVAGTGGGDVATNGKPFWFTVDFLKVKELTGIKTQHWGSPFSPETIELFKSEDGRTWNSLGTFTTGPARDQEVKFENHVLTRYLKYQMIKVPSRVDITKFHVYSWE